jgi:hypothetical protein
MAITWDDVSNFLANIGGSQGTAANTAAALGLGGAGLALAEKGYSDIGDIGERAFTELAGEEGLGRRTCSKTSRYAGVSTVHCNFCYWWSVWHDSRSYYGSDGLPTGYFS